MESYLSLIQPDATTDPTGTTNKLEKAVDQLNANIDTMSTFLGQLCQCIPNGECSREAQEKISHDPMGIGNTNGNAAKVYRRMNDATALP